MCVLIQLYISHTDLCVCPYTTLYISYCSVYVSVGALRDLLHVEEIAEQEFHEKEHSQGAQSDRSLQLYC